MSTFISSLTKGFDIIKPAQDIVKSLGVVFGDIGTSPLYTLNVIFLFIQPTIANVLGVISLIIWTLMILVTVEYAWLAMSLGKKGEGGTIVLKELLVPMLKSPKHIAIVTAFSFIAIALFFGDAVVTPAMTILGAVEGCKLLPWLVGINPYVLTIFACLIAIGLFWFQRKGTEKVSIAFGPIMLAWFFILALSGLIAINLYPGIIKAINPWYAIKFLLSNGLTSFLVLSSVILCATGGEALYADMGHLGRKPIQRAWYFVFIALICAYLGQGAFLITHPQSKLVLCEMISSQVPLILYISFLILSIMAASIASQSVISGIFSVVYQGITTKIMPMFKIDYTSSHLRTQVYINLINWVLMIAVLFMIIKFKKSDDLAAAYGFAVTGTMMITSIMVGWIFLLRKNLKKVIAAGIACLTTILFFIANLHKIPQGGYWSIIIALFPLLLILIYTSGQRKLITMQRPLPFDSFLDQYETMYATAEKISGSALFFVRDIRAIHPYVVQTLLKNNIVYEDNILVSVITRDDPFGVIGFFKGNLAPGLRIFEIHMGYMEMLDVEKILSSAGIEAKVMFYGLEEIVAKNALWKVFAFIKKISPNFVQFYRLPTQKLHGILTTIEM